MRAPNHRRIHGLLVAVAVVALLAAGCGDDDDVDAGEDAGSVVAVLSIADAWSRAPAEGQSATAVYGVVSNPSGDDVTIVAASSPVSDDVQLHETITDDDGVMQMVEREDGFIVPAGATFAFEPGGPHVMLLGIDAATYPDTVEVTLEFDGAEPLTFEAEVRAGDDTDMSDMDHDMSGDDEMSEDGEMPDGHGDDEDAEHADDGHGDGALDVSALHEVDEQLAAGELDAEVQRAVVADYVTAVQAMEPAEGSSEAELLAVLGELDAALAAGDVDAAAPLAASAHALAHDLGHSHDG